MTTDTRTLGQKVAGIAQAGIAYAVLVFLVAPIAVKHVSGSPLDTWIGIVTVVAVAIVSAASDRVTDAADAKRSGRCCPVRFALLSTLLRKIVFWCCRCANLPCGAAFHLTYCLADAECREHP